MPLRDYQVKLKADTYAAWQSGARNVLATLPTGGGKCLGRGTPVLMYDGTVRAVEAIQPGERVMGPDSKPRTVVSTCSGVEPLYRVKPTKGEPYVVNESHILSLRKTGGSEVVNVDVLTYLAQNKTFKHAHKGWRTGVNWRGRLVPDVLPPYLLGLWLGDGSAKCAAITTADPEVVDYLQAYCKERGWVLRTEVLPDNKANTYYITNRRKRIGSLPETMRALGLFDAKHVPPLYKVNDRETRLEVLAGLLDSDGYLHHGHYDAVFKSEQLANDLAFLSRSVGLAAYVRPCVKGATNSPTGKTGTYYRVSISGDVDMIPTRLPRHQPAPRRQIKNVLNVGIELEPLGPGEYFGFELDGPDRLFLLGDFTVTHNTVVKASIVEELNDAACCIAHRRELVGQISLAMAREGVRHRIIAPDPIIKWCARMQVDRVGRSLVYPNAQVAVAGVDTLVRPHPELKHWAKRVALWVQDECFPAGTLVDGTPIERLRVGDWVRAFNEESGGFENRQVVRLFKNPAPTALLRIETQSHHVIYCTNGHPIWTKRGWVNAGQIDHSDELFVLRPADRRRDFERVGAVSVPKNRQSFLLQKMRLGVSAQASARRKALQRVRLYASKHNFEVLQQILLRRFPCPRQFGNYGAHEPQVCVYSDDRAKPDAERLLASKDVGDATRNGARTSPTWGKRPTSDRRGTKAGRASGPVWVPIAAHRPHGLLRKRNPYALQNRLRQRGLKDRHRSRRGESFVAGPPVSGCQENGVFNWSRVASVQVLKSSDLGKPHDGFVYNIEVDGLHTYVANGVTVHNCHHVLVENKWGRALELFPNAKGLGVTATPGRADGKGLGRHAHGVFDAMVEGPGMRDLIRQGYLTEYRIIAPTVHLEGLRAGASGDFTGKSMDEAIGKSRLIGDIVPTWERYAAGKKTVIFAHNLKAAGDIADEFNARGWRAAVISSKNDDQTRVALVCKFERGDLDVLVNVDLFGEGFDLPAIECVVFARPTASLGLYMQQFGRVLRLLDGKLFGIVIDHVGNIMRHGLPDRPRPWTLDARERRKSDGADDAIPLRTCGNVECLGVYERIHKQCPYCLAPIPPPAERSGPQHVDGDLGELDPAVLARLRGEADRVLLTPEQVGQEIRDKYGPPVAQHAAAKNHIKWQWAQAELRAAIEQWCGYRRAEGHDDGAIMRRFYFRFGLDILSAQGIRSVTETNNLTARITAAYTNG